MRRICLALAIQFGFSALAAAQGCGPANLNCITPSAPATNNDQTASTVFSGGAVPVIAPDQFGVVDRTGAMDMGGIINQAITAASRCGVGGPGTVVLTSGTYLITTALIPKSCVTIHGDGRGQTILLTNNPAPVAQVSGSQLVHFELYGVTFKDSGSHPGATVLTFTTI